MKKNMTFSEFRREIDQRKISNLFIGIYSGIYFSYQNKLLDRLHRASPN